MAPHSSILAWKIPWMEEPGRLQSMRSQRVRHDWATSLQNKTKPVLLKSLKGGTVLRKWLLIHSEYVLKICQRSSSSLTHWTAKKFPKHFYYEPKCLLGFSSVQLLSRVRLFVTPWTVACQASLSITNSQSLFKLMSIKLVVPSNHLILCHLLLLLPSVLPSIRVFSNEFVLCISWPKYWSFSFSISPSNEYSGLISFRMDWLDLLAVQGTLKSLLQHHSSKAYYIGWYKSIICISMFISVLQVDQ